MSRSFAGKYELAAIAAGLLCVSGGMMTHSYFPWNIVPALAGGYLVGWLATEAKRK